MNKKHICLLLATVLLAGFSQVSIAKGGFIGVGIQSVEFSDDLEAIDDGVGFSVLGGYKINENVALEFMAIGSEHEETLLDGDADQTSLFGGVRLRGGNESLQLYLALGISQHTVDFEFFEGIDGIGVYSGFGAEIFMKRNHALDISVRNSAWDGEDSAFDYDVNGKFVTIAYSFHFGGKKKMSRYRSRNRLPRL